MTCTPPHTWVACRSTVQGAGGGAGAAGACHGGRRESRPRAGRAWRGPGRWQREGGPGAAWQAQQRAPGERKQGPGKAAASLPSRARWSGRRTAREEGRGNFRGRRAGGKGAGLGARVHGCGPRERCRGPRGAEPSRYVGTAPQKCPHEPPSPPAPTWERRSVGKSHGARGRAPREGRCSTESERASATNEAPNSG